VLAADRTIETHVAGLACSLSLLLAPDVARAERCSGRDGERIDFLESGLEQDATYARRWQKAWYTAYGAGVVAGGIEIANAEDDGERANGIAQIVKAGIGTARGVISPPGAKEGAEAMQAPGLSCVERVAAGEAALRRNAKESYEERFGWTAHAGNLALNLAHGLIVGEGFDEGAGWGSAAVGLVLGEVRIWTHPFQALERLETYEARFGPASRREVRWQIEPWHLGARLRVQW
jgi:hypothetical protein